MDIKGIGAFTPSVKTSGKPQAPAAAGQAEPQVAPASGSPARAEGSAGRRRVQAKDLLSEDEQRYLEKLFPGATGPAAAAETYAGSGRQGVVTPGTLVDRRG
jgi:hypothetical protein